MKPKLKINPEWKKLGPERDITFCFHPAALIGVGKPAKVSGTPIPNSYGVKLFRRKRRTQK